MALRTPPAGHDPPLAAAGGRRWGAWPLFNHVEPLYLAAGRIAGRQHGRITRAQLLSEGVGRKRIERWLADGRLRRVQSGVYALGHLAPSRDATYMTAVLAAGRGARLSHDAGGHMLRLRRGAPPPAEVTIPTTAHLRRPDVVIHRVRSLPELDTAVLDGIPITTVPRVLLDLAPRSSAEELARLCHEAWVQHGCGPEAVEACIARNPHKPGASRLRRALGSDVTLSALEEAFLALLAAHGLPLPRTNVDRHGDLVDCHWPERGLTVELVSYRYHATRRAFERDVARRRRSDHLAYSYGDVLERPAATVAELRRRLRT